MKLTLLLLLIVVVSFSACEDPIQGCTHPRAMNFDASADEDLGDCKFYQLTLKMHHQTLSSTGNTLTLGGDLYDADGEPFFVSQMALLGSHVHLFKNGSNEEISTPESIRLYTTSGISVDTENSFFIASPTIDTYNIADWIMLGEYDSLQFSIGLPNTIHQTIPDSVSEQSHPLSKTAASYMYNDAAGQYNSMLITINQTNSRKIFSFNIADYFTFKLPYSVTVIDGYHVPINLRLNYHYLFNGISLTNDDSTTIHTKLIQNIPNSFSTY